MLVVVVRTLILYLIVVFIMRIMGKRQIGQLQPFELVIAIMISELAALPMQDIGIPLINGIIPILTLLFAQITLSFIGLKNPHVRAIICGRPTILIQNGKINEAQLRKEMYSLNDLLEQLRIKDIQNIADVEFALLETNGQLSVIPKSQKRPVTPQDLNISTQYEGLSMDIIIDGDISYENLKLANLDINWLKDTLSKFGINNPKDVLFASLDSEGNLYYQVKERGNK
ncbi:DUF421 domain-containing protein [Acetivibrio mesophilus]|uniref:DUF421 domain-containing protein n=1 Tax=Acetivibrio mesophilus TaxID=2487273 RepID=A0A4Q0I542_9FIRM|nr:DUF421 domain-containing protein [Acetivibrio mesophilus]RXE58082.1 DUF421 domain-containing protein [Acetivibrio mesophilus]